MLKTGIAIVGLVLATGCSTTPTQKPTHYWEGAQAKPEHQYKADEHACQGASELDTTGEITAASAAFDAYKDCMITRGYVLRTY